jgi:hypothetical protein
MSRMARHGTLCLEMTFDQRFQRFLGLPEEFSHILCELPHISFIRLSAPSWALSFASFAQNRASLNLFSSHKIVAIL